jgi:hypothetical protein
MPPASEQALNAAIESPASNAEPTDRQKMLIEQLERSTGAGLLNISP